MVIVYDVSGRDEDLIPGYNCEDCGVAYCKDEMSGKTCIYCQTADEPAPEPSFDDYDEEE